MPNNARSEIGITIGGRADVIICWIEPNGGMSTRKLDYITDLSFKVTAGRR